jgi:hypothetical protein
MCGAVSESFEGVRSRKRLCSNFVKNYCCYVCSEQESCSIRCSYLDGTGKRDFGSVLSDRTNREVEKYQNEIGRLTVLHANGEIGEESFLAAIKALENKIVKVKRTGVTDLPSNLLSEPSFNPDKVQKSHEFKGSPEPEKPSYGWYLVPLLFGLLGGVIMYAALRKEDEGMASGGLFLGMIITAVDVLLFWYSGWLF